MTEEKQKKLNKNEIGNDAILQAAILGTQKLYPLSLPTSQKDRCRCSVWKLPEEGHHEM